MARRGRIGYGGGGGRRLRGGFEELTAFVLNPQRTYRPLWCLVPFIPRGLEYPPARFSEETRLKICQRAGGKPGGTTSRRGPADRRRSTNTTASMQMNRARHKICHKYADVSRCRMQMQDRGPIRRRVNKGGRGGCLERLSAWYLNVAEDKDVWIAIS